MEYSSMNPKPAQTMLQNYGGGGSQSYDDIKTEKT